MTRTQIRDLFARNRTANEIERALATLQERRLARVEERTETGGKSAEVWFATTTLTTETTKGGLWSSMSSMSYLELGKAAPIATAQEPVGRDAGLDLTDAAVF